ncbi:conserved hypothetical protein [Cupriavidus phytorum]|uniref:Zinc finger protein n=2 Tax=Cupriavidus TaxID=106589 RepID=A0A1C3VH69_9BURK|nr:MULTISPECIES: zf-HC2 domain-containing protein [Cupriavidus]MCO4861195.1 zf-HC2 domain-containing protein [Cupriavidus sp. WGlv3]PZX33744.1 putative zinc finger protein [Cupriavidus alkaliphilus]SCB27142.1 Putative zinc-finger [Cupriavidus alkaliphilus]SOY65831.1 conserved hypothetical protein [Cupriavidus taiwanensis]
MPETPPSRPPRRLLPDCEEVHHLTMKSLDLPLSWTERLRVRSHLAICDACTRFSAQMRTLREAMHRLGRDE